MSHPSADGHPAFVRLMTHRRRAAAVAALLVAAFLPLDLSQETGGRMAALVRSCWVALLLGAIAAQRPDSPRLSAAAARLVCFLSGVALVAIVAVTGGANGIYFHFLLALPLGAMVVAPDLPSSAALTALATTSGGAALLLRDSHPALHVVSWVLMSVAAGTLSLWGTILYARSWSAEVASERARARAAEELARSERRRAAAERLATVGRLAAGIAHEINNPLAYVKGNVEWLAESLPDGRCTAEQAREVLADTGGGVEHIARVVADLQAFARDDREVPGPCPVQELVEAALRLASTRLRRSELRVEIESGLPPVHAHARRISQAVLNLVVNAADALEAAPPPAGRGPEIRVRAGASGASVVIEVEDSGPGLSPEAAAHLFEPFFTTKGERGTGLGLALSRENVAASGGALEYEQAPGGGALFRVRLRVADAASGEPHAPAPGSTAGRVSRRS